MVKAMLKAVQTVAATNVVAFPRKPAVAPSKGRRKAPKGKASNVLTFTGVKRENYDAEARLPAWKQSMLGRLAEMAVKVQSGEITGLAILSATGVPAADCDPESHCNLIGIYAADLGFLSRTAEIFAEIASDEAQKHPSRPV